MVESPFAYSATEANFEQLVIENSRKGPVLVDFWASWAGPSLRQGELLRRLAAEYGGRFLLVTVNTDRQKSIAERFGVRSLPSCRLFRYGRPLEAVHGMQTEADYRALIERHAAAVADRVQAAALTAWEAGDRDKAIQVLAEGALAEPDNADLPLLMAKLLTRDGRAGDAHAVLDSLPATLREDPRIARLHTHLTFVREADQAPPESELETVLAEYPDRLDLRVALAARRLVADDYGGALEQLAEIQRRDPAYRGGIGRSGMLAAIVALGPDDPRSGAYRRMLFEH